MANTTSQHSDKEYEDSKPLAPWERGLASALGIAAGVAGGIAVFVSSNQAGSVALIIAATVLLLMGVQGTALLRFGSADHSAVFAKRQAAYRVIKRITRSTSPDIAEAYADAAELISPGVLNSAEGQAATYPARVRSAIEQILSEDRVSSTTDFGPIDFWVHFGETRVPVLVDRNIGTPLRATIAEEMVQNLHRWGDGDYPVLLVTDEASHNARETFARNRPDDVVLAVWSGAQDQEALRNALVTLANLTG
ncbi:hypothetical protein ACWDYH_02550 [Nocardia goodfellowii]